MMAVLQGVHVEDGTRMAVLQGVLVRTKVLGFPLWGGEYPKMIGG